MKQLLISRNLVDSSAGTATVYIGLSNGNYGSDGDANITPWSVAGTLRHLRVRLDEARGKTSGGADRTFSITVEHNGVDQALSASITDPAILGEDLTNTVTLAAGDRVRLKVVFNDGAATSSIAFTWYLEFESTAAAESGYSQPLDDQTILNEGSGNKGWSRRASWYCGPFGFNRRGTSTWTDLGVGPTVGPLEDETEDVMAISGAITRYDVQNYDALVESPALQAANDTTGFTEPTGVDLGWRFYLRKNGVRQDGTGGTVDTQSLLINASTSTSWSGALPVEPGDRIVLEAQVIGYTGDYISGLRPSVRVRSAADGAFMLGHRSDPHPTLTSYTVPGQSSVQHWNTTESTRQAMSGPATFYITGLWAGYRATGSTRIKLSVRKNLTSPFGAPYVELPNWFDGNNSTAWTLACTTVPVIGGLPIALGDTWGVRSEILTALAISPCVGGGTVATGTNPTDGAALSAATAPHAWIEVAVGGTTYRWAKVGIPHGNPKTPRVLSFGTATRALSDGHGGFEIAAMTISLSDYDRVLRGLQESGVLLNQAASVYVADETTIRAVGDPWRVFRGVVRDFRPEPDLKFTLVLEDALTLWLSSSFAPERHVPAVLIDEQISDANPTEQVRDKPVPLTYGCLTDEGEDEPVGTVLCPFIGAETVEGHESKGNMYKFLVGLGVTQDIQQVFLGDPESGFVPTERAAAAASEYGSRIFCPHRDGWLYGWPYSVVNNRRYTFIYVKQEHPGAELARDRKIHLLANVCGYETVGNGSTDDVVSSLPLQFLHFLNNHVAQDTKHDWLSIATFDGQSLFDTGTFYTTKTRSEGRIPGGYQGAAVLGHNYKQITLREAIKQFCLCGDFDCGVNRHGQLIIVMLDRTSAGGNARIFTDQSDILEGSFKVDPKTDSVQNVIRYAYKENYAPALQELNSAEGTPLPREPYDGKWLSGLQTVRDDDSVTDLGGDPRGVRQSELLEFSLVRHSGTADDVAAQRLALRSPSHGRPEVAFTVMLHRGYDIELGDIVKVTHYQGVSATGWSNRRLQVRRHLTDLDRMTVTLVCRDVHDLLA